MSAGAPLDQFTDFYNIATSPVNLTDPNKFINEASYRNYEVSNLLARSKASVTGGSYIQDAVFFDDPLVAETINPGQTVEYDNPQTLSKLTLGWRYLISKISFTAQEIELNEQGSDQFVQWKNLMDKKWMETYLSLANKIETLMTADASLANMENGKDPNSIFVTLTSDGLAPSGYTTVQNINPTTQAKWRNQTASYTVASFLDPDVGLAAGFDTLYEKVKFKAPVMSGFDQGKFMDSSLKDCIILTNREGMSKVRKVVRSSNDFLRLGAQDMAYPEPAYDGVVIRSCAAFDDVNSDVFTAGSPSFLFLNAQTRKMVYHKNHWMKKSKLETDVRQPGVSNGNIECWMNNWESSRQRSGWLAAS